LSIESYVGLTSEQIERIAQLVSHKLLSTPRAWGNPDRILVGKGVQVCNTLFNCTSGNISIGDLTFFGHNVCLLTGTHDIRKKGRERHVFPTSGRDIHIGEGVWIASNVTILGPCTIGDHAVIAAGSVVCGGDLPGGCVYGGIPARRIKSIDFHDSPHPPTQESG
jgi:acetyltransferase-like isoleucine patch superfamily enzyme